MRRSVFIIHNIIILLKNEVSFLLLVPMYAVVFRTIGRRIENVSTYTPTCTQSLRMAISFYTIYLSTNHASYNRSPTRGTRTRRDITVIIYAWTKGRHLPIVYLCVQCVSNVFAARAIADSAAELLLYNNIM